jgi:hypothetical protein
MAKTSTPPQQPATRILFAFSNLSKKGIILVPPFRANPNAST